MDSFVTVSVAFGVIFLVGFLFAWKLSKMKAEIASLKSICKNYEKRDTLFCTHFLLNVAPDKVRYVTQEEAVLHYTSAGMDDSGPSEGLYIINPTSDELAKINEFSVMAGCWVTWPLPKANWYLIPFASEEQKRNYPQLDWMKKKAA